jgi:hypothetical protein
MYLETGLSINPFAYPAHIQLTSAENTPSTFMRDVVLGHLPIAGGNGFNDIEVRI